MLALLLLTAGVALSGQTTFRTRVVTVPVTATVVDAQGRLVRGLTRDDFQVFEDGVEQPVTQFTDERVPVSLGLLLDASDSMRGRPMTDASAAVEHFVGDLLMEEDEAFIALFNHRPRLAAAWTRPASALRQRLGTVQAGGGTAIYDAVVQAAPFFDKRARPRAALVVISDGADTASDRTLQQAREAVVRRDAFVYAVAIDEVDAQASTRVNPAALTDLTSPTGGYTEVVRSAQDLGPATARIAEELNSQYTIGFNPSRPPDGSWRGLRVRVKRGGLTVRSRRGYVAEFP
jgi:Ca-activated chloride channel family protein